MDSSWSKFIYPITFREKDAKLLGEFIRLRHSVEVIGMKRVGISHFLRFFLYHKHVIPTYISKSEKHIFIPVDLNDLIERELSPLWILTFKRIVDQVENSKLVNAGIKKLVSNLFLASIQSNDLFLTMENIRRALVEVAREDINSTIFFIRFDRISATASKEFFQNLEGLQEATGRKASFVFTSHRPLAQLVADSSPHFSLSFLDTVYLKPAKSEDIKIIFDMLENRYQLKQKGEISQKIIELSGGHVQYLHLMLVALHQHEEIEPYNAGTLLEIMSSEERLNLLSEEIYESLSSDEKEILRSVINNHFVTANKTKLQYLLDSGIVQEKNTYLALFNSLFELFLKNKQKSEISDTVVELTKKEYLLYSALLDNLNQVCERDKIIEAVWPEYEEFGVSDWTIDRLTARLRTKLKKQNSPYSVITVKTRGYKLVKE